MTCGPWFEEDDLHGHPIADSILGTDASRACPEILEQTYEWVDLVDGLRLYGFKVLREVPGKAIGAMIEARGYVLSSREVYQALDALWRVLAPDTGPCEMFYWDYIDRDDRIPAGTVILATIDQQALSEGVAEFMAKCHRWPCEDEELDGLQACQVCYDQALELRTKRAHGFRTGHPSG